MIFETYDIHSDIFLTNQHFDQISIFSFVTMQLNNYQLFCMITSFVGAKKGFYLFPVLQHLILLIDMEIFFWIIMTLYQCMFYQQRIGGNMCFSLPKQITLKKISNFQQCPYLFSLLKIIFKVFVAAICIIGE